MNYKEVLSDLKPTNRLWVQSLSRPILDRSNGANLTCWSLIEDEAIWAKDILRGLYKTAPTART